MANGHPQRHELLDYIEGTLDPEAHDAVAEHLANCSACRELVADAAAGRDLLVSAAPLELSNRSSAAIVRALDAPPKRKSRPWRLVAVIAVALAIAIPLAYAAISSSGSDSGDMGAAATQGAAEADSGGGESEEPVAPPAIARGVKGKPGIIAAKLRAKGYDAVKDGATVLVTVEEDDLEQLDKDLVALGNGNTIVFWQAPPE